MIAGNVFRFHNTRKPFTNKKENFRRHGNFCNLYHSNSNSTNKKMRNSLKETIMTRDHLTSEEADEMIEQFENELTDLMEEEDTTLWNLEELMESTFGLEPDYLDIFIM